MAVPECNLDAPAREKMKNKEKMHNYKEKKALLEHQEVKLAKALAGNNKQLRDKALKNLKRWMINRSQAMRECNAAYVCDKIPRNQQLILAFMEDDFMRIWKGLFYSMWMSDKPLVQEKCAESISEVIHLPQINDSLLFYKCALKTFINEWFGIDQLRLDKFLMLFRRLLRQALIVLKTNNWEKRHIVKFNEITTETILNTENVPPIGLSMHYVDIFLEELAKVSEGNIQDHTVSSFIKPFVQHIALTKDNRQLDHTRKHVFHHLLKQSEAGIEYEEKYNAWRNSGFVGGNINSLYKEKASEDELLSDKEEQVEDNLQNMLDPRAGFVDVVLPQLRFSPKQILQLLEQFKFSPASSNKARNALGKLIEQYQQMAKGIYPLGVKKIQLLNREKDFMNIKKAAKELVKFDNKIMGRTKKRKRQNEISQERNSKKMKLTENPSNSLNVDDESLKANPLKRKHEKVAETGRSKIKKVDKGSEVSSYDFKFKRNSGTWFVTSTSNTPLKSSSTNRKNSTINSFVESPNVNNPIQTSLF